MVQILKSFFLGIVEGITEWLPISSTGHLILVDEFIKLNAGEEFKEMFNVVIQLGAILAVVVLYFHKLNPFSRRKSHVQKVRTVKLWIKVLMACIPAAVLGLLLDDWLDEHLYNYVVVSIMLIIYGILFIVVENRNRLKTPTVTTTAAIDVKTALLIGCFQVLSLIPGTSRSGATIVGALLLGVSRSAAAEFTFFLAIPVMFGASAVKIVKFAGAGAAVTGLEAGILIVGCLTAFFVSLVAIKFLMNYVKNNDFKVFGYYRIALGTLVLVYFAAKKMML